MLGDGACGCAVYCWLGSGVTMGPLVCEFVRRCVARWAAAGGGVALLALAGDADPAALAGCFPRGVLGLDGEAVADAAALPAASADANRRMSVMDTTPTGRPAASTTNTRW